MATNSKNGVFGGMAARGGRGGGCRGARGPISRGFGTSPHSFPQPTITRKAQTNRRGRARPTGPPYGRARPRKRDFGVFEGMRARWRPPRGRCAAALQPQNRRKTGPQRARSAAQLLAARPSPGDAGWVKRASAFAISTAAGSQQRLGDPLGRTASSPHQDGGASADSTCSCPSSSSKVYCVWKDMPAFMYSPVLLRLGQRGRSPRLPRPPRLRHRSPGCPFCLVTQRRQHRDSNTSPQPRKQ